MSLKEVYTNGNKNATVVYADGGSNPNRIGGYGWVTLEGDRFGYEGIEYATNQLCELYAIQLVIETFEDNLVILTDSQYCINMLENGYQAHANVEIIRHLKWLMHGKNIKLVKIPGKENSAHAYATAGKKLVPPRELTGQMFKG